MNEEEILGALGANSCLSDLVMARFIKFLAVAVVVYALVGFFVVPPIAKKQIEERLEAELGRSVTVARVRVNPFAISATIEGLEVSAPDGSASWIGWQRFYVNADPLKSVTGDWVVGRMALEGFHGAVEVDEEGALNFADLIEKFGARAEEPSEPSIWARPVRVDRLDVTNAQVTFTDRSKTEDFETVIGPMNFALTKFRTEGSGGAAYRFEAASEAGERFQWMGTLGAAPLRSMGDWRIEKLQLAKYGPYLSEQMQAVMTDGELTAEGSYELSLAPNDRRVRLSEGALQLKGVRVLERKEGAEVVELGTLEISGVAADAETLALSVDAVRLDQGRARVVRGADGTLNVLEMLKPVGAAKDEGEAEERPAAERAMDVAVKEIVVSGFAVDVRDEAAPEPVETSLENIEATVTAFTLREGAPVPVNVAFDLKPEGAVKVNGNVTVSPFQAVVGIDVARVAMAPFSSYLQDVSQAKIARGWVSVKGDANVAADGSATFSGEARVEDVAVAAGEQAEVAGLREFTASDIKVATTPRLTLSTGELKVVRPFAHVVRAEDGTLNVAALAPQAAGSQNSDTEEPTDETDGGAAPEIAITRVLVEEGEFTFSDRSMAQPVEYVLAPVSGALRNLSSLRPELGDGEFRAQVNRSANVHFLGRVNPLASAPFADVRLAVESVDLLPASPYFGKFAGYELASGRLFVTTTAKLEAERLDMNNAIKVEQFELGAATNSPDAVKLPVRLGVALLKDAEGKIVLDVPVQGSLTDPQFDIGKVVGQVFSNLFTKAATSPFALLGSMFGGGGEELGQQDFEPGTPTPTEASRPRLDVVRRALVERPALKLEIEPGYDRVADAEGFKRAQLDELLRVEVGIGAGEEREFTPEERERGVRQLFLQRVSADAGATAGGEVAGTEAPAQAPVSTELRQEEERRGILRRTWDIATLKGARDWISGRSRREAEEQRIAEERQIAEQREAERRALEESAPAAEPSLGEMERAVLASIEVAPADLAELANRRAEHIREVLLADGAIDEARVTIARVEGEPKVKGARAVLHLR